MNTNVASTKRRIFTSESVTEGHPDKLCDQISDAVLDAMIQADPSARVACETAASRGLIHVMGEITADCRVDVERIVRDTIAEIGYTRPEYGLSAEGCGVLLSLSQQSQDISMGVDVSCEKVGMSDVGQLGAGDQGMMFGYANSETDVLMPLPIYLAHRLAKQLAKVRKDGTLPYLRPDGKSQISICYEGNRPVRADTILLAAQHDPQVTRQRMERDLLEHVIQKAVPQYLMDDNTRILVNTTGRFVKGGPEADCGLTGRKIIVDTYGGYGSHGGGAFSGKDPTKVDRTGCYAARHAAKNLVAAGLAQECLLEIAYAIGMAEPVSLSVDTKGTGVLPDDVLAHVLQTYYDFRPTAIIERFDLRRPLYKPLAAYGHFGREELDLPWERLDFADHFKAMAARL